MQKEVIKTVKLKSTLEELNNIIVQHIQKEHEMKITSFEVNEGVVLIIGLEEKDRAVQLLNGSSNSIIQKVVGRGKGKGKRQQGLTTFIRSLLKDGDKMHIDAIHKAVNSNGFDYAKWKIKSYLRSYMKEDITEVNKDVFQSAVAYKRSHNGHTVVQQ